MLERLISSQPFELTLKGTFKEIGQQYAETLGPRILQQIKVIKEDFFIQDETLRNSFDQKVKGLLQIVKAVKYPREIMDIYLGMVDTDFARNNQLTLDDLIYLDFIVFISTFHPNIIPYELLQRPEHCSYVAITQKGGISVGAGRTFDWPSKAMHALTSFPVIAHLQCTEHGYPYQTTLVGHVGSISAFTLFNEQGLSWALNSANMAMNINIPGGMRFDRPYLVAQTVVQMFKANTFSELLSSIEKMPSDYPSTVSIAGPGQYEMASIEMCPIDATRAQEPNNFKNLVRAFGSNNAVNPKDNISSKGYAQTNLVHLDWEKYLGHPPADNTISFARERYNNLQNLIDKGPREKSLMKTLVNILNRRFDANDLAGVTKLLPHQEPYTNELASTYYRTAFVPGKDKFKVSFQHVESMDDTTGNFSPWHKVRINRI